MNSDTVDNLIKLAQLLMPVLVALVTLFLIPLAKQLIAESKNESLRALALVIVQAIEQMFTNQDGRLKYARAANALKRESYKRGYELSREEMRYLIESAVHQMNTTAGAKLEPTILTANIYAEDAPEEE